MRSTVVPSISTRRWRRLLACGAVAVAACAGALFAAGAGPGDGWSVKPLPVLKATAPPFPPASTYPVQLFLDDDSSESAFGVTTGVAAKQFLWLNSFPVASPFVLQQIWVLFPANQGVAPGDPIDLVVYTDNDGDPSNGASLVTTVSTTVQFADGTNFSVYSLPTPPSIPAGNVLVGVIDRYVVSGVTPVTQPAALDTDNSQQRSWVVTWTGDPPNPALLPGTGTNARVDDLTPSGGNWMIRAFGTAPTPAVPTLDMRALALLALALIGLASWFVRR